MIITEAATETIEVTEKKDKSTHKVEVVPVVLETHPNAQALSIVRIFGYTVCVRTSDWLNIDKAAYIVPDSLVPLERAEFAFLKNDKKPLEKYAHVKVKKLRGVVSQGLLVPAPEGSAVGDDVAEQLGVTRYNPPEEPLSTRGDTVKGPEFFVPKYDVDSAHRYAEMCFIEGEPICITEKIHGANGRWVFSNGQIFAGSRSEWKKYDPNNIWWKALLKYPEVVQWLIYHPSTVLFGEVYGNVQDLKYGHEKGEVSIALFDIMRQDGSFVDADEFQVGDTWYLPWVPFINEDAPIYYSKDIFSLAEGQSLIPGANHMREGIVIKPWKERYHDKVGRVCLKIVSNTFLES